MMPGRVGLLPIAKSGSVLSILENVRFRFISTF
jgi:hypothetical protein